MIYQLCVLTNLTHIEEGQFHDQYYGQAPSMTFPALFHNMREPIRSCPKRADSGLLGNGVIRALALCSASGGQRVPAEVYVITMRNAKIGVGILGTAAIARKNIRAIKLARNDLGTMLF